MNEHEPPLVFLPRDAGLLLSFHRQTDISALSERLIGLRAQDPLPRVIVQALGRRCLDEAPVSDAARPAVLQPLQTAMAGALTCPR